MNILETIDFDKNDGIVPAIAQDANTNEVLMMAYMNKQSLELTLSTGFAHYFSRSKQKLWKKGETSGHTQEITDIMVDCDNDTILLKINQQGVACHTGRKSCFFKSIKNEEKIISDIVIDTTKAYGIIDTLYHTILQRKTADPKTSWTAKLLQGKQNSLLKKIVEEAGEFAFAIKDDDKDEIVYEAADITYHVLVALASKNINPYLVKEELNRRFGLSGIVEKNNRKD
jgi:phosphoribosyl-ATP pyrophosphohydrolase/phosphoribosyl-AMP cyclohydrolase